MSGVAITVENVSKSYLVGHNLRRRENYVTLRDVLARNVSDLARKTRDMFRGRPLVHGEHVEEFWALKNISFNIQSGERVGIIGRNGAGKSTLLKVLSRITEPTTGRITLNGRVSSLLEVGTGFHPELTGRENIYLNGAILGMSRAEIRGKFDEIVSFAEVEQFVDTPVKRYSSGMYVRLAFSVSAHLDPEILIVDEVLAVGDAQFQRKCMGKMEGAGREGVTVLFVSHNMTAVRTLCTKAISLNAGQIVQVGDVGEVIEDYFSSEAHCHIERLWSDEDKPNNEHIRLKCIRIFADEPSNGHWTIRTPLCVEFSYNLVGEIPIFYVGFHLKTLAGDCIFVTASPPKSAAGGPHRIRCRIPADLLNNGVYTIHAYFVRDGNNVLLDIEGSIVFEIHDVDREMGAWMGSYPGAVRPRLNWILD